MRSLMLSSVRLVRTISSINAFEAKVVQRQLHGKLWKSRLDGPSIRNKLARKAFIASCSTETSMCCILRHCIVFTHCQAHLFVVLPVKSETLTRTIGCLTDAHRAAELVAVLPIAIDLHCLTRTGPPFFQLGDPLIGPIFPPLAEGLLALPRLTPDLPPAFRH